MMRNKIFTSQNSRFIKCHGRHFTKRQTLFAILPESAGKDFLNNMVTCNNHTTSQGEQAIVVYNEWSVNDVHVNCPMCELEKEICTFKIKLKDYNNEKQNR